MTEKTPAFLKLTLEVLQSPAWRALTIPAWHLLNFLMAEHMKHGGKANGNLVAPRRQLEEIISPRYVSYAIEQCEILGLIDVRRGFGRLPNRYALTWLPLANDSPPTRRFQQRTAEANAMIAAQKAAKSRKSPRYSRKVKSLRDTTKVKHVMLPK